MQLILNDSEQKLIEDVCASIDLNEIIQSFNDLLTCDDYHEIRGIKGDLMSHIANLSAAIYDYRYYKECD